jgi:prepilin-type N-terminal cleavage/methylation domain-containing protein
MQGGENRQPLGYTIVEVLIVLAISAVMFVIAANFINGKQERTAFIQGVNEMASRLQDTVDQVTNGHYSDVPISCSAPGGPLDINVSSPQQGKNQECVFLGKIVHFYANGTTFPQNYETISLADSRSAKSGANWNDSATGIQTLTTQGTIPQNLEVHSMTITPSSGPPSPSDGTVYNIGFAQGLGTADALSPDTYQSGSQTINLIYASSVLNQSSAVGAGNEKSITGAVLQIAQSATICLSDGNRSANIFIGGVSNNSNQLSIRVEQLGTAPCP